VYTKAVAVKTLVVELQHSAISLAQFKPIRARIGPFKKGRVTPLGWLGFWVKRDKSQKALGTGFSILPSSVKRWRWRLGSELARGGLLL